MTVLCIADRERFAFAEQEVAGVRYVEAPDVLPGRLRSGWDPVSVLRRSRYLKPLSFDLIMAFEARPAVIYPALALQRRLDIPMVMDWVDWWGRGGLIAEQRPRWYQVLFGGMETYYEEHFRIRADQTTVISHALADRARSLGVPEDTITWIPGGIDTQLFSPRSRADARKRWDIPGDATVLVYSAMDVTNDAEFVFESVGKSYARNRSILLLMAGHPSPAFQQAAARHGFADAFRHVGLVPHRELPDLLAAADIGLLPFTNRVSNVGRWPNKVGDYMAMGLPTITNPVGEIKLLLDRAPIGIAAAERADDFAAAINTLADDSSRRAEMGAVARRLAENEFDWRHIMDQFEVVLKKAQS